MQIQTKYTLGTLQFCFRTLPNFEFFGQTQCQQQVAGESSGFEKVSLGVTSKAPVYLFLKASEAPSYLVAIL